MSSSSFALLAGPQMLGFMFNWGLLGTLNLQVYLYHSNFPKDRPYLKALVYGILAFEWAQTGLVTAQAFDSFVYNFGNTNGVLSMRWVWFASPIMGGIIAAIVQMFFAWRIYAFTKVQNFNGWQFLASVHTRRVMYILVGIIILLSWTQGISGIVGGAMLSEVATAVQSGSAGWPLSIWLTASAIDDIIIALTMTVLLLGSKTGFSSTDALVNKITRLTVETGSITASMALLAVIIGNIPQTDTSLLYQFPWLIVTKLHANTFLANLNNRSFMKDENVNNITESIKFSEFAVQGTTTGQSTTVDLPTGSYATTVDAMKGKSPALVDVMVVNQD